MTEDQFNRFVEYTEGQFDALASKVEAAQEEFGLLRAELCERFDIVHDRLVALETGQEDVRSGISKVRDQINDLGIRMDKLESHSRETNRRLTDLRDDMQQRFRVMNERLSALEQRIAA